MQKYSWDQSCLAQGPNPNCSLTAGADFNRCMTACGYPAGEGLNLGPDFLQQCFDQCTRTFNEATSGCTNNVETCLQRGEVNYSNDLEYCNERWGGGDWEFWYRDL